MRMSDWSSDVCSTDLVLRAVPDSVLWLLGDAPMLQANLRAAAEAAGVAAHRLVFAGWLPKPEHLARLALADLHFATGTLGAHTTASAALSPGWPHITVCGAGFASPLAAPPPPAD